MKIALCLSGQARFHEKGIKELYDKIIQGNHCDVFIHTWSSWSYKGKSGNINKNSFDYIQNLKKIIVEDQISSYNGITWANIKGHKRIFEIMSMWYSLMRSNELRNIYEQESNIKYDAVIRSRFDLGFNKKDDITKYILDNKTLINYYRSTSINPNSNDFGISNSKVMNAYADIHNQIPKFSAKRSSNMPIQQCRQKGFYYKGLIPENTLLNQMYDHGVTIKTNKDMRLEFFRS